MNPVLSDKQRDSVLSLAHKALGPNNTLVDMAQQVHSFLYGEMPSGDMFILAPSSSQLGIPNGTDGLLVMSQETMKKVQIEHNLSPAFIARLPEAIKNHVLALDSLTRPNSVVLVLDELDSEDLSVLVAVHLHIDKGQAVVDEVPSVYGKKDLQYLVENTFAAGKNVYVNERTSGWISRTGVPFPERIHARLEQLYHAYKDLTKEAPPAKIKNPFANAGPGKAVTPAEDIARARSSAEAQAKGSISKSRNTKKQGGRDA